MRVLKLFTSKIPSRRERIIKKVRKYINKNDWAKGYYLTDDGQYVCNPFMLGSGMYIDVEVWYKYNVKRNNFFRRNFRKWKRRLRTIWTS